MNISWCPKTKVPALQAFLNTHWKRGHVLACDADLLCWQYRNLENPDSLSVVIAEEEDQFLGFLGCIPGDFSYYGEKVSGLCLAMWMVLPEGRRRRVGLDLLRATKHSQFKMVETLGLNENTGAIFANLGFEVFETIPRWVRVISPMGVEKLLSEHPGGYSGAEWKAWKSLPQISSPTVDHSVRVVDWSEDLAGRWDQAWKERFSLGLLGTWRDAAYIRWRYLEHPSFQYVVRFLENLSDGALMGLVVYRVETVRNREEKILRIVEFLCDESLNGVLTNAVLEAGKTNNVALADFYCTSGKFALSLEAAGFVREDHMPVPLPHLFQPLDFRRTQVNGAFWVHPSLSKDCHEFFRKGSLYVTSADGDQDRPN
jgi:hypothetical protein